LLHLKLSGGIVMPCKYVRVRAVDVGRKEHHYIKVGVRRAAGKRGGHTERIGGLRIYVKAHMRKGRRVKAYHRRR
jgi:hypothetical protein